MPICREAASYTTAARTGAATRAMPSSAGEVLCGHYPNHAVVHNENSYRGPVMRQPTSTMVGKYLPPICVGPFMNQT